MTPRHVQDCTGTDCCKRQHHCTRQGEGQQDAIDGQGAGGKVDGTLLGQPQPAYYQCMFEFNDSTTHQQLNLNLGEVTRSEIQRTIKSMKNNKVPGIDEIPAELLNHGKNSITGELTHLSNRTWTAEDALDDWSEE